MWRSWLPLVMVPMALGCSAVSPHPSIAISEAVQHNGKALIVGNLAPKHRLADFAIECRDAQALPSETDLQLLASGFINAKGQRWFAVLDPLPSGTTEIRVDLRVSANTTRIRFTSTLPISGEADGFPGNMIEVWRSHLGTP